MYHSVFKNLFTLLCLAITLFLIYDLLETFLIERPTTTTKIEKELETSDLPNVVVCLDPGFNNATAEKYGYHISYYWAGLTTSTRFVGWNGVNSENKSSSDILEEMLLFPDRQELFAPWFSTENFHDYYWSNVTFRRLMFPLGRCMFVSPLSFNRTQSRKTFNRFGLEINNSAFDQAMLSSLRLRVFLMDHANSPHLYPDQLEMEGDPIEFPFQPGYFIFKTKISKSEHVLGDPLYNCAAYTANNSFDDCRKREMMEPFEMEIGCQPPPIAIDEDKMCNKMFNFSKERSFLMQTLFWSVAIPSGNSRCKVPCTKSKFTTRRFIKTPLNYTSLHITFDHKIAVARSRFSINEQAFLTKVGGFIGVGRTSLWILVSLLGASQVVSDKNLLTIKKLKLIKISSRLYAS